MQVFLGSQKLYVFEFQYQTVFFLFFWQKKWYPEKFMWKFKIVSLQCLVLKIDIKLRYRWPIRFEKLKKISTHFLYQPIPLSLSRLLGFSMKHLNTKGLYKLKECFVVVQFLSDKSWSLYENASWQRNLSMYVLKKLFFLKTFFVRRIFLTTFYLTFCSHHFFKTHPSCLFAQRWFVKGSKVSSCRDLLGMNRSLNF